MNLQKSILDVKNEIKKLQKKANRLNKIANYLEARSFRDMYFYRECPDEYKKGYSMGTWLHIVKSSNCSDTDIMFDYEIVVAYISALPDAPLFYSHYVICKENRELCYDTLSNFKKMMRNKTIIESTKEEFDKHLEQAKKEVVKDTQEYYNIHKQYESDGLLKKWFELYVDKRS